MGDHLLPQLLLGSSRHISDLPAGRAVIRAHGARLMRVEAPSKGVQRPCVAEGASAGNGNRGKDVVANVQDRAHSSPCSGMPSPSAPVPELTCLSQKQAVDELRIPRRAMYSSSLTVEDRRSTGAVRLNASSPRSSAKWLCVATYASVDHRPLDAAARPARLQAHQCRVRDGWYDPGAACRTCRIVQRWRSHEVVRSGESGEPSAS